MTPEARAKLYEAAFGLDDDFGRRGDQRVIDATGRLRESVHMYLANPDDENRRTRALERADRLVAAGNRSACHPNPYAAEKARRAAAAGQRVRAALNAAAPSCLATGVSGRTDFTAY